MKQNRIVILLFGVLFTLSMLAGGLPGMNRPALASTQPYSSLVPKGEDDATALAGKTVHFCGMDWYLIEDNSTDDDAGTVTLLAREPVGESIFHSESSAYEGSEVRKTLEALTARGGAFEGVAKVIADTELPDVHVSGARLYLLSTLEANRLPVSVRRCPKGWWLRSPGIDEMNAACVGGRYGDVSGLGDCVFETAGVRPAVKLRLAALDFSPETRTFSPSSRTSSLETGYRSEKKAAPAAAAPALNRGNEGTVGGHYLTFTGTQPFTLRTGNGCRNWNGTLEVSTDTENWTEWDGEAEIPSDNNVLYVRGRNNTVVTGYVDYLVCWEISSEGTVACDGDIRSLLNYADPADSAMEDYCFSYLFCGCECLTSAPELPATTLASHCYESMFEGCTSLTTAPELPAIILASCCYSSMFSCCTGLTSAPALPAPILSGSCYYYMFYSCTGLTSAPELPARILADSCYASMFAGCTGLETAPELPATTLEGECYLNMFDCCYGLKAAPKVLPATTLAEGCYGGMFSSCTSLTSAPEFPAEVRGKLRDEQYADGMFGGCTSLKTPVL